MSLSQLTRALVSICLPVLLLSSTGCDDRIFVRSDVLNKPLTYQNGETVGKAETKMIVAGSNGIKYKSQAHYKRSYTNDLKDLVVGDSLDFTTLVGSGQYQYGLFSNLDVMLDVYSYFVYRSLGFGAKGYLKYQLTPKDRPFAASVMVGVGYTPGSTINKGTNQLKINSSLSVMDIYLPMSYRVSKHGCWNFGGVLTRSDFESTLSCYNDAYDTETPEYRRIRTETNWVPGVSVGFHSYRARLEFISYFGKYGWKPVVGFGLAL